LLSKYDQLVTTLFLGHLVVLSIMVSRDSRENEAQVRKESHVVAASKSHFPCCTSHLISAEPVSSR
jgi:hypothetical protein